MKSQTQLSDFTFTFHVPASEKEMASHSSVLAWRIPETGEPGRLPSMGSHRVGHDWSDLAAAAAKEKLPNIEKETHASLGCMRVPYWINPTYLLIKQTHVIKLTKIKNKDKVLSNLQGNLHKVINWFSIGTLQARREWHNIYFRWWKGKTYNHEYTYPARFSFIFDGEIKSFTDMQKLRKFSSTQPALQEILK